MFELKDKANIEKINKVNHLLMPKNFMHIYNINIEFSIEATKEIARTLISFFINVLLSIFSNGTIKYCPGAYVHPVAM